MIEKLKINIISLYQTIIDFLVITMGKFFIEPKSKTPYWID